MKEVEKKDHIKSEKDQKEEDVEVDKPEENHRPEGEGDDGTQDATRGVPDPTESFHPQEDCSNSVQEASRQHLTLKELDEEAEAVTGQAVESSKVVDEEDEEGSTKQVTEHHFDKKESDEKMRLNLSKKNKCQENSSG